MAALSPTDRPRPCTSFSYVPYVPLPPPLTSFFCFHVLIFGPPWNTCNPVLSAPPLQANTDFDVPLFFVPFPLCNPLRLAAYHFGSYSPLSNVPAPPRFCNAPLHVFSPSASFSNFRNDIFLLPSRFLGGSLFAPVTWGLWPRFNLFPLCFKLFLLSPSFYLCTPVFS